MTSIYKYNVIRELEHLSSAEYQIVAWYPNNKNIVSSYIEDVLGVFDDSGLLDMLEAGRIVFSKEADNALLDLWKETEKIDEFTMSDDDIFKSTKMQIVRQKASYALELVKNSTSDTGNVQFLAWIHICILEKELGFTRRAIAEELPNGFFRILKTQNAWHDYPLNEKWEFNPNDIVICEKKETLDSAGNKLILAIKKIG